MIEAQHDISPQIIPHYRSPVFPITQLLYNKPLKKSSKKTPYEKGDKNLLVLNPVHRGGPITVAGQDRAQGLCRASPIISPQGYCGLTLPGGYIWAGYFG